MDRAGVIDGTAYVVDIKTGAFAPWHPVQVWAYRHLLSLRPDLRTERCAGALRPAPIIHRCAALYLRDDGTFRFETEKFRDRGSLDTFMAALRIAKWKRVNA